jgi:uncharacterized membrane protein
VTSFCAIGAVWLAHHAFFSRLRYVDTTLMRVNLALLLAVAFLPFPTGLMSSALDVSRPAERAAVVVYGLTLVAIDLLAWLGARHAARHETLLHEPGSVHVPPPAFSGYVAAGAVGVLLLPRIAVFGYLALALWQVAAARDERTVR